MPNIVALLVYLLVFCIVVGLGYWVIANFLPDPIKKFAFAVFYVIIAIFVIYFLLTMVGGGAIGGVPRLHGSSQRVSFNTPRIADLRVVGVCADPGQGG